MPTIDRPLKQGANAQTPRQLAATRCNLSRRPAKPAKLNGKLQRATKRALTAFNGQIDSGIAADWSYPRDREGLRSLPSNKYRRLRRALATIGAKRIARARTRGRPWIWKLAD
jgi:hypothetical protein